jgi:hypothetical protein
VVFLFLKSGSSISYSYTSSQPIDFYIFDGYNFNRWWMGQSFSAYKQHLDQASQSGTYVVGYTEDIYLVWHNDRATTVDININLNWNAVNVLDFSVTTYYQESVTSIDLDSITVPSEGNWYFFIYFDPMDSTDYSTTNI